MLSSGEIYHMSFRLRAEFLMKGVQVPIIKIREELKKMNAEGVSREEMERRVREMAK